MLESNEPVLREPIADGLVMRTAACEQDVERVAEFNGLIHGPGVVGMARNLFLHHPATSGRDLIWVEDEAGRVISSLCVIPWTWCYEGVDIRAGEMGIVGTLPEYRRRGLVRVQIEFFKRRLRERGCLLSHIQGIPYYYRQFGYEYALPLEGGLEFEAREIAPAPDTPFAFRPAAEDDLPALMRLYDEAAADLGIHAVRDEATWHYLRTHTAGSEMECEDWVLTNPAGEIAGYLRLPLAHFGDGLTVNEVSRLDFEMAKAVLGHLKTLAEARHIPGIRLNVPASCTLMRLAESLVGRKPDTYAWQIHVPDMAALLRALVPVLEKRLAGSPLAGFTGELTISLYQEALRLTFQEGRLQVAGLGPVDRGPVRFPPLQFIPLVLGQRTAAELAEWYPDASVAPAWRMLVDTLFPRTSAFLYTIY